MVEAASAELRVWVWVRVRVRLTMVRAGGDNEAAVVAVGVVDDDVAADADSAAGGTAGVAAGAAVGGIRARTGGNAARAQVFADVERAGS